MLKDNLRSRRQAPLVLVENKMTFAAAGSQLSIYDTFERANNINLASDQLMFCGMVSGKKVMHGNEGCFESDFLPHESFIMAPNNPVKIDFPTATFKLPTTCIAIEMSSERIKQVCDSLNVSAPLARYEQEWHYDEALLHVHHSVHTQALLDRMVHIYIENHQDRSFMIDLAVHELIARLLRHQTRDFIISHSINEPDNNGINAVIDYLHNHLKDEVNIDQLCKLACMSRTKFFDEFKQLLGVTPQAIV